VLQEEELIAKRARDIIYWGVILTGVLLSMVGIVRFGIGPIGNIMHDVSATGMGVVLGVMMLAMPRLIRQFPRLFYIYSFAVVAMLVVAVVLFILGFYSLTGLELAAFGMSAVWLLIFYRNVDQLVGQVRPGLHM
jgi:hypothetical protein